MIRYWSVSHVLCTMRVLICESNYGIQKSLRIYRWRQVATMISTYSQWKRLLMLNFLAQSCWIQMCHACYIQNSCKVFFQLAANTLNKIKRQGWRGEEDGKNARAQLKLKMMQKECNWPGKCENPNCRSLWWWIWYMVCSVILEWCEFAHFLPISFEVKHEN